MHTVWWESLKGKDCWDDLRVHKRYNIKMILQEIVFGGVAVGGIFPNTVIYLWVP